MKLKALFLLEWFMKLNGFSVEFDNMTTLLGSKQDMVILHRAKK